ncbi:MAG: methyltransferase domain-containing protein [Elusimicrobia bacterium]|nr:methyltransferase domain-containing protein [Elusimicrobiota bacterium]
MIKDPKERFSGLARGYSRFRPGYPPQLVDWIVEQARLRPGSRMADIGCGTGISTRLFLARGFDAVGVDPNEDMLSEARRGSGSFFKGDSSATGLRDSLFDLVIAAQAFHWFPLDPALAEFSRILRPEGCCCAFWNIRETTPLLEEYEGLLRHYSAEYKDIPKPDSVLALLRSHAGIKEYNEARFGHIQTMNRDEFFGRVYSSSFVALGVAKKPDFDRELAALFERHQSQGRVSFHYRVLAALWRPA